jgi:NAD(P)H-flavin reductase
MALAAGTTAGDELRLGPPAGALRLDPTSGRDLVLIAGSTGLAPLKAILEQLAAARQRQLRAHLFVAARTPDGLYDLASLEKMAAEHAWLTVTPTVTAARGEFAGATGVLSEVVARHGSWSDHDAYLAGPTDMVRDCAAMLAATGLPGARIHTEDFGWSER